MCATRSGRVLTHTVDSLFHSAAGEPTQMAVVELESGGRFYGQVANEWSGSLDIGDRCHLGIRLLHKGSGLPHYYWKVLPDGPE